MDLVTEILTRKYKEKMQYNKDFVVTPLELALTKKPLIFLELSMKYLEILNDQPKKL